MRDPNFAANQSPDDGIYIRYFMRELGLKANAMMVYAHIYEVTRLGLKWEHDNKTTADIAGCSESTARRAIKALLKADLIKEVDSYVRGDNTNCRHFIADMSKVEVARYAYITRMQAVADNPAKPAWDSDIESEVVDQKTEQANSSNKQDSSNIEHNKARKDATEPIDKAQVDRLNNRHGMTEEQYQGFLKLTKMTCNKRFLSKAEEPYKVLLSKGYTPQQIVDAWETRQSEASLTASSVDMYPSLWKWLAGLKGLSAEDYILQNIEEVKEIEEARSKKEPKYKITKVHATGCGQEPLYYVTGGNLSTMRPLLDDNGHEITAEIEKEKARVYLHQMIERGLL